MAICIHAIIILVYPILLKGEIRQLDYSYLVIINELGTEEPITQPKPRQHASFYVFS